MHRTGENVTMRGLTPKTKIIQEIEAHTNQQFGETSLTVKGSASFSANWDGCLETVTGGKTVNFTLKAGIEHATNIGSKKLGWYAQANAAAMGQIKGQIYMVGKDVKIKGNGSITGIANYDLGWQEKDVSGNWQSKNMKDRAIKVWKLFNEKETHIVTLPSN